MEIYHIPYYGFIALGAVLSAGVGYYLCRRKGLVKPDSVKYIVLALTVGIFSAFFMGWLQTFLISFTELPNYNNRMRIFGGLLFSPLIMYFPVKYSGGDFDKITDIFAPGTYLLLGCAKLGCASFGCCHGIEWEYGIASRFVPYKVFPVQLLESVMCFILFAVIFITVIKEKHPKGTVYPISLILYGVMRFFVEYLREYTPLERTYFLGINFWQMFCVISVLSGTVWFIHKYLRNNRDLQKQGKQCEE